MTKKKILVLLGHPDQDSFCGYLADRYEETAREAGHEVRRANIGDLQFDPILHKGYKVIQQLEPDLLKLQEDFKWADHLLLLYPNWWCTMPAILKGLFDRFFLPGFAFKFVKPAESPFLARIGYWRYLMKGKTARVVITMNVHPFIARVIFGDYSNEVRRGILGFAGFSPVRLTTIGPIEKMTPERRASWGEKIKHYARLGY